MKSLKSNFLKIVSLITAILAFSTGAEAQSVAKIDLIHALSELPPPPTSVADALSKATCVRGVCNADGLFKAFEDTFAEAQKQWGVINAGQVAQVDSAKRIAAIMQPVAGSNSTNTQKLEAAKQLPGANMATLNFAQQMQDPAFKAKFGAMSPQDKLAYIQSSGMTAPQAPPPPPPAPDAAAAALAALSDTTYNHLKALEPGVDSFMNIINDTTFIFGDSASMARMQNALTPTVDSLAFVLLNIITAGDSTLNNSIATHDKQLKATAIKKKIGSISDDPGYHAIRMTGVTKEIADENATLPQFDKAYGDARAILLSIIAPFNKALIASNYCASFTTPADQQLLTGIAQTQVRAMAQIDHYSSMLKELYRAEANLGSKQQSVASEKVTPYKENAAGEGNGG